MHAKHPGNWWAPPRANRANPPPQLQKLPGTTAPSTPSHLTHLISSRISFGRDLISCRYQFPVPPRRGSSSPGTRGEFEKLGSPKTHRNRDLLIWRPSKKEAKQLTDLCFLPYSHDAEDGAVIRNIEACQAISGTVQTSLGPYGRNKIVINHLQKMILTSDAATILRELDVVHPAAKLLVMASQQQDAEMGDGTNLVIVLAGELLKKAEELIRMGLKTSDIVSGYEKAQNFALSVLEGMLFPFMIGLSIYK